MSRSQISCGRELHSVPNLTSALENGGQCGFDFVSIPLVHPRYRRDYIFSGGCHGKESSKEPLTRSDLIMPSGDWMSLVVGKISPWIHVDSADSFVKKNSEKALMEELMLSSHLNIPVIYVHLLGSDCINLARCLLSHCGVIKGNQGFWICVPLTDPKASLECGATELDDTWKWWNKLRNLCENEKKLSVALEIGMSLPSLAVRNRWMGEPVRALVISTDIFVINRRGFPVLKRSHQEFLLQMFKLDVQLVLKGACQTDHGIHTYYQYLDHLYQNRLPPNNMDVFAKGYNDYLQNPLQPLMDNLDSHTYEVFEKDPVKYKKYEEAIAHCLKDKVPEDLRNQKEIIIMIVGAGRGPLVQAALRAASTTERLVKIYAVEKNPGAVVTLRNRQREEWGNCVTVVSSDMRYWTAPEKADLLVSELLGSFGDNELSPECLDGAQRFLKANGVSIPTSYNSYLVPLSAPKLYSSIEECREKDKKHSLAHYETPYVVRLWNANSVSVAKKCFTFSHPNQGTDNDRYVSLTFQNADAATLIHGLAGYFDTQLYGEITLSILPQTHTKGMISWFPIFFPFKKPVYVEGHGMIEVHIWRCSNSRKVWYEWALTHPVTTGLHNSCGRSYWIGL